MVSSHAAATPAHVTIRAFGLRAALHVEDPAALGYLAHLLRGIAEAAEVRSDEVESRHQYRITAYADLLRITVDGRLLTAAAPHHALAMLLWDLNRRAATSGGELVILHAAGLARRGWGLLLPAPQEAGKTTLAAALVRAGFDYLSDELVAVDPVDLHLVGYPKALAIDRGAQVLFPDLAPLAVAPDRYEGEQWHIPADAIRAGSCTQRSRPAAVVFPQYVPGASGDLRPIDSVEAIASLASSAFDLDSRGLTTLGELATTVPCYTQAIDGLDAAVSALSRMLDSTIGSRT